uniref:Thyroid transcription factor 1-associated protein 26 n=1 Tax=Salvator merianae TaxID=96440 RepID=A0A8D0BUK8_SALMN
MAPVAKKRRRDGAKAEKSEARSNRKQTWWRDPRRVRGSIGEGQGFAFWRKQKIQRDYKKLLKKNKNTCSQSKFGYTDDYPEHLKHLYLAEEELLKKQQKQKNDRPPILEDKDSETVKCNPIQRKFKTSNQKAKEEYEKIKSEQEKQKEVCEYEIEVLVSVLFLTVKRCINKQHLEDRLNAN